MPGLRKRGLGPAWFCFASRRTRAIWSRWSLGLKQACKGVFDTVDRKRLCPEGSGFAGPADWSSLDALGQAGCLNERRASLQTADGQQHMGSRRPVPAVYPEIFMACWNVPVSRPLGQRKNISKATRTPMKRILLTLFALFATVNLAHGQTLYYSSVGMESSVRWTHTEANYALHPDSVGTYLGEVRFYVSRGFDGEALLGCGESDAYVLRGNNDWSQVKVKLQDASNDGKIEIHQTSCESEDRWGLSVQGDFSTDIISRWDSHVYFVLNRPAPDTPLGFQDILVTIHVADDTDDFNAKISNLENVPEALSGPICGLGLGTLCDTSTSSETLQELPNAISLKQNYPNPFNPSTAIEYELSRSEHVRLEVFDAMGRSVAVLTDGMRTLGQHSVRFDGRILPSGLYVYRLQAGTETLVRKMMLVR